MHVLSLDRFGLKNAGTTFTAYIRKPLQVAMLCPSSKALTRALASRKCISRASKVIDLGAGTGVTTKALLDRLPRDGRVIAVELTDEFIPDLLDIDDHRLVVEHEDARSLRNILGRHQWNAADVIVSGIPFSSFDDEEGVELLQLIKSCLRPGGRFLAYQFRPTIKRLARHCFTGSQKTERVWWNLPPLKLYEFENV